jgi:hypothetical protein
MWIVLLFSNHTQVRYVTAQNPSILVQNFFFFGATAPIWALAYFHETLHFTSVY